MTARRSESGALVITGPTASGKTELSISVARRLGGEIISMDSRQVYRGMDIGTAKASPEQRTAVPHHGLDLVDPGERFSAGRFARYARQTISEIRDRGKVPILVGGTGFFLRALTNPIFREPEMDPLRRQALQDYLDQLDTDLLLDWLGLLDPPLAARFTQSGGGAGRQRLHRGIEIALLTGRPLSWWQKHGPPEAPPLLARVYVVSPPREQLYAAIDRRVGEMLDRGLLDEVRALRARGFSPSDPGMSATGYVELLPVLNGEASLQGAADRIRRNTRAYARRQLTWLRHQLPAGSIWLDTSAGRAGMVERIVEDWQSKRAGQGD